MDNMYGHFVKEIPLTIGGPGSFESGALMEKSFFGFENLSVRLGVVGKEGPIFEEIDGMHYHDFEQHIFFFSTDPDDMLNLGAEIEFALGEEGDRYRFYVPTLIAIPPGMPHFPATVRSLEREFYFMSISSAPEFSATAVETDRAPDAGALAPFRSPLGKHIIPLLYRVKGGYFYGSEAWENSGGLFASVDGSRTGLNLTVSIETINTAHTMGPRTPTLTHVPHVHQFDEVLLFLGNDTKNPAHLGCDAQICYGKEMEPQPLNTPVATMFPIKLPHCPMSFQTFENPIFFIVISCAGSHH